MQTSEKKATSCCSYFLLITNIFLVGIVAYLLQNKAKVENMIKNVVNNDDFEIDPIDEIIRFSDCADYWRAGHENNGIYTIQPNEDESSKFKVYCNMDLGGWTVIMRRDKLNDKTNFNRPLLNYKTGFGDLNYNHWLGLNRIHILTTVKPRDMMFYVDDAQYKVHGFRVDDEYSEYKLVVMSEIDKMPNECSFLRLNNTRFSTNDYDFDLAPDSCSLHMNGEGWWFTNCYDLSIVMTGLHMHSKAGLTKFTKGVMMIK